MSAWLLPFCVSTAALELPCMRPSAFQVLWPWRTRTTRLLALIEGSGKGGASTLSASCVNSSCQMIDPGGDEVMLRARTFGLLGWLPCTP